MHPSSLHYFPLPGPYLVFFAFLAGLLFFMIEIRLLCDTFEAIGVDRRYVLGILFLVLVGSYVNIPVAELPGGEMVVDSLVRYYGIPYVVPVLHHWSGTVIAVNLGGCLLPVGISLYLLRKNRLWGRGLLATAITAAVIHPMAHLVPGVGIAVPIFVPALVAVAVALLLSRRYAASLAYVGGSIGALVGADLLNLWRVQGLGAPVVSIGGAGTFDGIFLTGLLALLLAVGPFGGGRDLVPHHAETS
jgi:uncharacterized membrane protein